MEIHDIQVVPPDFRRMKVVSGWLYNFWNYELDDYNQEWVFVPEEHQFWLDD